MAEEIITSTNAETATDHEYNASEIQVLKGLEAVRKRPGMYIGSTGERGLHHLVYEIVDNAIDEALAGYCDHIEVKILKDNIIQVTDNGRGIPVDIQADTGLPAVTVVYTILHAGGKFGGENSGYKVAGGLHGVGASVVNACSEWLTVNVRRDGHEYEQTFRRGDPDGPLKCIGPVADGVTGTRVTFKPDPEMFRDTTVYDFDAVGDDLRHCVEHIIKDGGVPGQLLFGFAADQQAKAQYRRQQCSGHAGDAALHTVWLSFAAVKAVCSSCKCASRSANIQLRFAGVTTALSGMVTCACRIRSSRVSTSLSRKFASTSAGG